MRAIEYQVIKLMQDYKRTGSKASKQEEIDKLVRFVNWVAETQNGVKRIEQIGRRHIYAYYKHLIDVQKLSANSIRKYERAIDRLWRTMDRAGAPPIHED